MKKLAVTALAAGLLTATTRAQAPAPGGLAQNTVLQTELAKSIDAKSAKPGGTVTAKLTQDVLEKGRVVLPRGSKMIGHVTEAQAHGKERPESRLGLLFDKIVVKGGQEVACSLIILAVAPPVVLQQASSRDDNMGVPQSMGSEGNLSGGTVGGVAGPTKSGRDKRAGGTESASGSVDAENSTGAGLTAQGVLSNASRGVIGLEGLTLISGGGSVPASVLSSAKKNVKLESGTQLLLQVAGQAK